MEPNPGRLRAACIAALPAMALGVALLAPFLTTPFTIDDPIFLTEAQHILKDPLHPQSFDMVWTYNVWARASKLLPGGALAGYALVPVVLSPFPEVAGHIEQMLFLCVGLWATALIALRLGLDRAGARWAALIAAASPAAIGMAGTVMPDIPAMVLAALGMERMLAWREERKIGQALASGALLAVAALTRAHAVFVVAAALVFLLDGIDAEGLKSSLRGLWPRFLPIVCVAALTAAGLWITHDSSPGEHPDLDLFESNWHLRAANGLAFLAHWLLTTPFIVVWLAARWRKLSPIWLAVALVCTVMGALRFNWMLVGAAALSAYAIADVFLDALRRRDRDQLALALWLLPGLAPFIYVHLPSKYLLPSLPAAAILAARALAEAGPAVRRRIAPAMLLAGAVVSALVLIGTRDLALTQKDAAARFIAPRVKAGQRVLYLGQWGFHWYAEKAGGRPATMVEPLPEVGDIVVVSFADFPFTRTTHINRTVLEEWTEVTPGFRVMDLDAGAGFFSNGWGVMPVAWGTEETNRFEVWRME